LKSLDFEQYADAFATHGITADTLPELVDEDLRELGINSLGHRKKLLAAIHELARIPAPIPSASMVSLSPEALANSTQRLPLVIALP